jgi:hypothetical protein
MAVITAIARSSKIMSKPVMVIAARFRFTSTPPKIYTLKLVNPVMMDRVFSRDYDPVAKSDADGVSRGEIQLHMMLIEASLIHVGLGTKSR